MIYTKIVYAKILFYALLFAPNICICEQNTSSGNANFPVTDQGTIEARTAKSPFTLLYPTSGATFNVNDVVVLEWIGGQSGGEASLLAYQQQNTTDLPGMLQTSASQAPKFKYIAGIVHGSRRDRIKD